MNIYFQQVVYFSPDGLSRNSYSAVMQTKTRSGAVGKVARHWIEHVPDWRGEAMAYWVHIEQDASAWSRAESYTPPAPKPAGRAGFPVLCVESQGFVFRFSSKEQLAECIDVLGRKPLPTSRRLSALRGGGHGPNSHWLSRLPGHVKAPKARERAVADLHAVVQGMATDNAFKSAPAGVQGLGRSRGAYAERNGIPLLRSRAPIQPVTLELVNGLRDEQP